MVALCLLLDDPRRALALDLLPKWEQEVGSAVWIVGGDYGEETAAAFEQAARFPVQWVRADLTEVGELPTREELARSGGYCNPAFLHKMAVHRESVRQAALALPVAPRYLWWIDADTDPGPGAIHYLHQVLTTTTGPLAPRAVSGLYCERHSGQPIPQHWGSMTDPRRTLVDLHPGRVVPCGFAGFGCVLMTAEAATVGWGEYGRYRFWRRSVIERDYHAQTTPFGIMGEDVYWFRRAEATFGVPLYLDTRVLCRHYHEDGSYWTHLPEPGMPTRFVTEDADPRRQVTIRNDGPVPLTLQHYPALTIAPGFHRHVSPEVAGLFERDFPDYAVTL